MLLKYVSILALAASQVSATERPDVSSGLWACYIAVDEFNYTCDASLRYPAINDYYACLCSSDAFLGSFMYCLTEQLPKAKPQNFNPILKTLLHYCHPSRPALDIDGLFKIHNSYSPDDYLNATALNESTPINSPVKVDDESVMALYKTNQAFYYNQYHGEEYGGYMLLYFAVVLLIATVFNFIKNFMPGFVKSCQTNSLVMSVRKKFANTAFGGYKHSTPLKWGPFNLINASIPTRVQTWVCLGYFAMFVIFNCVGINAFTKGNVWYPTRRLSLGRAVADRSGILATTQLPLVYLFAGRNNFTLWLTGWSYDTMSAYHRWTSRVMFISVFIHSVAYTDFCLVENDLAEVWAETFITWGIAATVCGGLVLFFSLRYFRERLYEFFLVCHWAFIVFFTIGTWYHVEPMGYPNWVWGAIGVWAFDRVARFVRIIIAGYSKADTVALPDDYIKMKIKYSNLWSIKPGQYIFIHYLKPFWGCWQSHPFTCYQSPIPGEEKILVVVLKVRDGITKSVNKITQNNNNQIKLPVLIDGPYGQHFPIAKHDSMIFISGGIGFSATYSYACKLKSHTEKKRVVFIWVTRNHEHVEMFRDELKYLVKDSSMEIQIYLTGESSLENSYSLEKKISDETDGHQVAEHSSLSSSDGINYTLGKPDFAHVIGEAVAESSGSIGVMVCGPPGMNDTVRRVTVDNLDKGSKQVNLYTESFNW